MATHTEFNDKTTATQVAAAFGSSIAGKNVVLTGVSPASIGFTTAKAIASQGPAHFILASRTQTKLEAVQADLQKQFPAVDVQTVCLDLGSVESVKTAAAAINGLVDHIDVLINNAGVNSPERLPLKTPEGTALDTQLFTNHLGVFLFTALLLERLRAAESARVVNLSSQAHHLSPVRFSDYAFFRELYDVPAAEQPSRMAPAFFLRSNNGYPCYVGYGQSKTANILHARELTRRLQLAGTRVEAFAVHPGTIDTELSRSLDPAGHQAMINTAPSGVCKTQDEGAATTLVAAFDPKLAGEGGGYLNDCQLRNDMLEDYATDEAAAKRLWEESERLLAMAVGI